MEGKPQTLGEKLVGISFNPSQDPKVQRAKELCAELADLVVDSVSGTVMGKVKSKLVDHALGEVLNAQMNVVKVLTFQE